MGAGNSCAQKKKNTDVDAGKKYYDRITFVLKVDRHCEGCASKFIDYLRHFPGVETANEEGETGKLTVTGKVDPIKVRDKLAEKMKKKVELISPQHKKEKEKEKENKKYPKPDNKPEKKIDDKRPKHKEHKKEKENKKDPKPDNKPEKKIDDKKPKHKEHKKDPKPDNKPEKKIDDKKPKHKEPGYGNIGGYNCRTVYQEQLQVQVHVDLHRRRVM